MTRVLLVDDEVRIRRTLGTDLRARGYEVDLAGSGREALDLTRTNAPDVVLLDLGLPDRDGVEVIDGLRSTSQVPIIVLSVRGEQVDKVRALDAGADDYVTKPFGMDELLARLRAALRRQTGDPEPPPKVVTRHFELDLAAKRAWIGGEEVRLTPIEWGLTQQLVSRPGRLVSQRQLLRAVWGPQYGNETNYLRVHLANLRRKLEPEPSQPRYFVTEPGMGYRFHPEEV